MASLSDGEEELASRDNVPKSVADDEVKVIDSSEKTDDSEPKEDDTHFVSVEAATALALSSDDDAQDQETSSFRTADDTTLSSSQDDQPCLENALSGGSGRVAEMRVSWDNKSSTGSQLLNLDDFLMQQRAYKAGDLAKKGEAYQYLHSFRNVDTPEPGRRDKRTKQDPSAADRAAVASYQLFQSSKKKKAEAGTVPHRTLSLKSPPPSVARTSTPVPTLDRSNSWRTANGVVTDAEEFYHQQHVLHVEDERKKREILHISDKSIEADRIATPVPDYKKPVAALSSAHAGSNAQGSASLDGITVPSLGDDSGEGDDHTFVTATAPSQPTSHTLTSSAEHVEVELATNAVVDSMIGQKDKTSHVAVCEKTDDTCEEVVNTGPVELSEEHVSSSDHATKSGGDQTECGSQSTEPGQANTSSAIQTESAGEVGCTEPTLLESELHAEENVPVAAGGNDANESVKVAHIESKSAPCPMDDEVAQGVGQSDTNVGAMDIVAGGDEKRNSETITVDSAPESQPELAVAVDTCDDTTSNPNDSSDDALVSESSQEEVVRVVDDNGTETSVDSAVKEWRSPHFESASSSCYSSSYLDDGSTLSEREDLREALRAIGVTSDDDMLVTDSEDAESELDEGKEEKESSLLHVKDSPIDQSQSSHEEKSSLKNAHETEGVPVQSSDSAALNDSVDSATLDTNGGVCSENVTENETDSSLRLSDNPTSAVPASSGKDMTVEVGDNENAADTAVSQNEEPDEVMVDNDKQVENVSVDSPASAADALPQGLMVPESDASRSKQEVSVVAADSDAPNKVDSTVESDKAGSVMLCDVPTTGVDSKTDPVEICDAPDEHKSFPRPTQKEAMTVDKPVVLKTLPSNGDMVDNSRSEDAAPVETSNISSAPYLDDNDKIAAPHDSAVKEADCFSPGGSGPHTRDSVTDEATADVVVSSRPTFDDGEAFYSCRDLSQDAESPTTPPTSEAPTNTIMTDSVGRSVISTSGSKAEPSTDCTNGSDDASEPEPANDRTDMPSDPGYAGCQGDAEDSGDSVPDTQLAEEFAPPTEEQQLDESLDDKLEELLLQPAEQEAKTPMSGDYEDASNSFVTCKALNDSHTNRNAGSDESGVVTGSRDAHNELQPLLGGVMCAPSASSTEEPVVAVDYKSVDYRGFIFAVHEKHGLLLLHCTRKKSKGPHFQLPGGHVDEPEFVAAARSSRDKEAQLLMAAKAGAARELYEETGMDMRNQVDRLEPAILRNEVKTDKNGNPVLTCEYKHRLYFFLPVTDDDFVWTKEKGAEGRPTGLVTPLGVAGSNLMLKLSIEHSRFKFEKDLKKVVELLQKHSGGKGAEALMMATNRFGLDETKTGAEVPSKTTGEEPTKIAATQEETTKSPADAYMSGDDEGARAPPDLLPPPEQTGLSKLFSCQCCLWF